MSEEPKVWVCPECGEPAEGDMCMICGNVPPIAAPVNRTPIAYGRSGGCSGTITTISVLAGLLLLILLGCGGPAMTRAEYSREMTSIAKATTSALTERPVDEGVKRSEDETHQRMRARFGEGYKVKASRLDPIVERIRELRPPSGLVANRRSMLNLVRRTSKGLRETGDAQIFGTDREADDALLKFERQMSTFSDDFLKLLKEAGVDESVLNVEAH